MIDATELLAEIDGLATTVFDSAETQIDAQAGLLLRARAEIERLRALTTPQPIETAPRDGREIIGINGDFVRVCVPKMFCEKTWEYFRDETHAPGHTWSMEPTHWLPLPEAPK